MVDDRVPGSVERGGEQPLGERHADRVGQPLSERAGGRLDAGRDADLGMARRLRMQLPETAQLRPSAGRSPSDAAARTAASSHGRSTARSGRDRASADWPGCGAGAASRVPRRSRPCPSACRDGRISPPRRRPSPARGSHWRDRRRASKARSSRCLQRCSGVGHRGRAGCAASRRCAAPRRKPLENCARKSHIVPYLHVYAGRVIFPAPRSGPFLARSHWPSLLRDPVRAARGAVPGGDVDGRNSSAGRMVRLPGRRPGVHAGRGAARRCASTPSRHRA